MEWVPLSSVQGRIAAGEIWISGALVALLRVLTADRQSALPRRLARNAFTG